MLVDELRAAMGDAVSKMAEAPDRQPTTALDAYLERLSGPRWLSVAVRTAS